MTDLFVIVDGQYVPELAVDWFLTEASIAYREYSGTILRQTKNGWEFQSPLEFVTGENGQMWEWTPIYPSGGLWNMIRGKQVPSPFALVKEFESAKSPYTDEYEIGEYVLVGGELIPRNIEQISNINELDLYTRTTAEEVYTDLRHAVYPLRDQVYGIIFVGKSGTTYVDPKRFDWSDYDA